MTLIVIFAITVIAGLEAFAITRGINGIALSATVAAIVGLVTNQLPALRFWRK